MSLLPIDPKKPVAGNLSGTFAGFIAIIVAGYLADHGWFVTVSNLISSDLSVCLQIENGLFVLTLASVGSVVNYAVTHFSQVRKLKEL